MDVNLGDSDGQGRPVCYSLWGHKELDMTERPNNKYYLMADLKPDNFFSCSVMFDSLQPHGL